ncbi:VpaChn25_0724 family phage protein [Ruegeria atlantica]|uniref:VpaChn25_0724 family phage protein n=1 Tax=Ruegeria atlantica TaxID=81569 RepID=UPI001481987D|nr:hypothetical protein [Ruegeria atlantica]
MSFANALEKDRRLRVLQHLAMVTDNSSNAEILLDVLNGLRITTNRDRIISTLTWLREAGMVTIEDHDSFLVVEATPRGVDVALGRDRHPGVRRPAPQG